LAIGLYQAIWNVSSLHQITKVVIGSFLDNVEVNDSHCRDPHVSQRSDDSADRLLVLGVQEYAVQNSPLVRAQQAAIDLLVEGPICIGFTHEGALMEKCIHDPGRSEQWIAHHVP
jgi:hypothetical protein